MRAPGHDDEIEFHIEMRTRLLEAEGLSPQEARRQARLQFGNPAAIKEDMRSMHISHWFETLTQDVRYAVRSYLRNPSLALTALAAIAIGIGACTAVFSVVDRILFRPLPYTDPDRLVSFGMRAPIEPSEFTLGTDYVQWRRQALPFEAVTSWRGATDCDLTGLQSPMRLRCARVEANMLDTLGVRPLLGRGFNAEEDRPGQPRTALLSYGLWQSQFGGDPAVLGRAISLDGEQVRVLGVLPATFELPTLNRFDVLVPQLLNEAAQVRPNTGAVLRTFARLKSGVTIEQAKAQMEPLFRQALQFVPPGFRNEVRLEIRSLRERQVGDARRISLMFMGAVGAVLLLACANVAGLLLARAAARQHETAVRLALGASRSRLVRQLLTESGLLAICGGAAGCFTAWGLLAIARAGAPSALLRMGEAAIDARVLGFAILCSIAAGVICALLPAFTALRSHQFGTRERISASRALAQRVLVAAQIAGCIVLLSGATLLLRSVWNLQHANLGLDQEQVLTASLLLGPNQFREPAARAAFYNQLEERIAALPGAESAAMADTIPPTGQMHAMIYSLVEVAGRPQTQEGTGGMVGWRSVSPGYFRALGIRIDKGRAFTPDDRRAGDVMILSRSLAARLFHNEDPIGKRIRTGRSGPWRTVVGVAENVANAGARQAPDPEYYFVRRLQPEPFVPGSVPPEAEPRASVIVRSSLAPQIMRDAIKSEIATLAPTLPVTIETMRSRVLDLTAGPRFQAIVLSAFAASALLLAAIGLYGVIGFMVARRTREIGVRMALGATQSGVRVMVLAGAAKVIGAGLIAGLAITLPATRLLKQTLFGVPEKDPATIAAACSIMIVIGLFAAYLPARRASRVDPVAALRHD